MNARRLLPIQHLAQQREDDQARQFAEQQKVLESIADEAAYEHPVDALNLVSSLPVSSTRDNLIAAATAMWAATAPEDAAGWAKQIPDEMLRGQTMANVVTIWAVSDPVAAGKLAVNSMNPGPWQDRAVISIVEQWGRIDMSGATAWVDQFPEGTVRQTATAMLAHEPRGH